MITAIIGLVVGIVVGAVGFYIWIINYFIKNWP
jgi:hypothetical protein